MLLTKQPKTALRVLEKARQKDFRNSGVLRDMATAYAQLGQMGMASLLTAERYALLSQFDNALIHSKRAASLFAARLCPLASRSGCALCI